MNKVILIGRITKDPEVRYNQDGTSSVLNFSLAIDRGQRDAQGNRAADFINCVAWNQPADYMSRFIKKGYLLCVTGRIQNRNYPGKDGQMRYVTEVVVETVENLTPRDNTAQPQGNYQQPQNPYQQPKDPYQGYSNPTYGQQSNQQNDEIDRQMFDVDLDDGELPY
jgi:single-strand DNA-binding protein